jgi:hypothetical protein
MSDAYKNLPASSELRLQAFCWLQACFVETQQAFRASTAVAAFDRLGHTILDLAILSSQIPRSFVFRTFWMMFLLLPCFIFSVAAFGHRLFSSSQHFIGCSMPLPGQSFYRFYSRYRPGYPLQYSTPHLDSQSRKKRHHSPGYFGGGKRQALLLIRHAASDGGVKMILARRVRS